MAEENSFQGVYKMSNLTGAVYCLSDLEGFIPKFTGDVETAKIVQLLGTYSATSEQDDAFFNTNGFVFCGDAMDRGEESIRIVKRFTELKEKEKYSNNICLLAGNRDANKLRLIDEFALKEKVKTVIAEAETIEAAITAIEDAPFLYDSKDVFNCLVAQEPWKLTTEKVSDKNTFETRADFIFKATMGCPKYQELYTKEFTTLFGLDFKLASFHKFFVLFWNVMLGLVNVTEKIPLKPYQGLYIKYAKCWDVIAHITTPGDKVIVASHSGLPFDNKEFKFYLPSVFGEGDKQYLTNGNLSEEIGVLNGSFREVITNVVSNLTDTSLKRAVVKTKTVSEGGKNVEQFQEFEKNADTFITKLIYNSAHHDDVSKGSPMSSSTSLLENGPKMLALKLKGKKDSQLPIYNVFGHQPVGITPVIAISNDMYNICIDISKAETIDYANKTTYTVLKFTQGVQSVFGYYAGVTDGKTNSEFIYHRPLEQADTSSSLLVNMHDTKWSHELVAVQESLNPFSRPLVIDQREYTLKPPPKQPDAIPDNKTLIITTGDTSDADGFIALAQYAKTGADVCFVINLSYVSDPLCEENNYDLESTEGKNEFGLGFKGGRRDDTVKLIKMCIDKCTAIFNENKPENTQSTINFLFKGVESYFYNTINPFHPSKLNKDDTIYNYTEEKTEPRSQFDLETLQNYNKIFVDMNGSCAFMNYKTEFINKFNEVKEKVKGLYVMGGILLHEPIQTIAVPFLNRLPCATMNQVYAPKGAWKLMKWFIDNKKPIYFVSNNEVNKNADFKSVKLFDNGEKNYENLANILWPFNEKQFTGTTLNTMIKNYYVDIYTKSNLKFAKEAKLFDPMVANVLIKHIRNLPSGIQAPVYTSSDFAIKIVDNVYEVKYKDIYGFLDDLFTLSKNDRFELKPAKLVYDTKYGSTILCSPTDTITTTVDVYNTLRGLSTNTITQETFGKIADQINKPATKPIATGGSRKKTTSAKTKRSKKIDT